MLNGDARLHNDARFQVRIQQPVDHGDFGSLTGQTLLEAICDGAPLPAARTYPSTLHRERVNEACEQFAECYINVLNVASHFHSVRSM